MRIVLTLLIALAALPVLAQNNSTSTYNTTTTTSTTTSSSSSGNVTSTGNIITTTGSNPGIYTTHHDHSGSGSSSGGYHAGSAAAATARQFPYDSTNGANRSDIDTPRKGFDDPRDPWDGRYSNDNPDNYGPRDNSGNGPQLSPGSAYTPGNFGTRAVTPGGYSYGGYHH